MWVTVFSARADRCSGAMKPLLQHLASLGTGPLLPPFLHLQRSKKASRLAEQYVPPRLLLVLPTPRACTASPAAGVSAFPPRPLRAAAPAALRALGGCSAGDRRLAGATGAPGVQPRQA
jgi:hypothetical protein